MLKKGMALNQQFCFEPLEEEIMPKGAFLSGKMRLRVTPVFDTYWKFACERQSMFFRRLEGLLPWTHDPILATFRFTNPYRAADRVSQFLIREVV